MDLDSSQLATLKTWLTANTAGQNDQEAAVSANAMPGVAFTVWRTDLTTTEVNQQADWAEVVAMSAAELLAFQALKVQSHLDMSLDSMRQAFNSIFPSGTRPDSNANLIALAKRLATEGEKTLATGTGSDASPAIMGAEGDVSFQNVVDARRLP